MPLSSNQLGSQLTHPIRLVDPSKPGYFTDAKREIVLYPSIIVKQTWTDVPANVTNGIVTSHAGAGAAGTTTRTPNGSLASGGVATLTPARNVVITVTHASSVVAMSGTITGTRHGRTVTEAWSVTATGTSKTFTGAKAFDTVTSITEVIVADASANTIIMGTGKVLGLDFVCSSVVPVGEEQDAALPGTPGVIVKGSTSATADARGTYTPNAAPNGSIDWVVRYFVDSPAIY